MKTDHTVEVITVCKTINNHLIGQYLGVGGIEMPFLVDTGASSSGYPVLYPTRRMIVFQMEKGLLCPNRVWKRLGWS